MPVDLDEIEMRQAIDHAAPGDLANPSKIIGIDLVDIASGELFGADGHAVEHLVRSIEKVNRAEDEIEALPIFLDPALTRNRVDRIVVELDTSTDSHVRVRRTQFVDLDEGDSFVVAIVIGESDVCQIFFARAVNPGLQ